jgi:hypothetical protein
MSTPSIAVERDVNAPSPPHNRALARLNELKRGLQRQLRRKPNVLEKTVLEHAAVMALRAEMAAFDPKSDANTIVRLSNAARRAMADFERLLSPMHKQGPSYEELGL